MRERVIAEIGLGIVGESSNGVGLRSIPCHLFRGCPPRWLGGLDDCSKTSVARLDWSHSHCPANDQHRPELGPLG
jgi:hypothetical protein